MRLEDLNALDPDSVVRELLQCCGSSRWARQMAAARPFASAEELTASADRCWGSLDRRDWLEAFAAHPKWGRRGDGHAGRSPIAPRDGPGGAWGGPGLAAQEQPGGRRRCCYAPEVANLNRELSPLRIHFHLLRDGKRPPRCWTSSSAGSERFETEIRIAADEQRKITRLRLTKLVDGRRNDPMITTHVLDITRGEPAEGVTVILELRQASEWTPIGAGRPTARGA